jgi:hypothetical protein
MTVLIICFTVLLLSLILWGVYCTKREFDSICKHQFGDIINGTQICTKCGYLRYVSEECKHEWDTVSVHNVWGSDYGIVHTLKCKKCGDVSYRRFRGDI